jgi:O-methyltransferase
MTEPLDFSLVGSARHPDKALQQQGCRKAETISRVNLMRTAMKLYAIVTAPFSILFVLHSKRIHPAYRMTTLRKLNLGLMMLRNKLRIPTGTSFKAHLAMALKLLETPPEVEGCVIECGTWKGGSAANLSLCCRIVGRKLLIFDSFEGLPEADPRDNQGMHYQKGDYSGPLNEVRTNVSRYGAIECCEFVKGWFEGTLPQLERPVLLAFLDVDLEASLQTCVRQIWNHLGSDSYLFIDECVSLNYCALFFSETWWQRYFNRKPPGLIGAGTGLPLGEYYIGPHSESLDHPLQHASTGAYTRPCFSGYWSYYPEDTESKNTDLPLF